MKRILSLLLIIILILCLSGCNKKGISPIKPINFYYRTRQIQYGTADDVITYEIRDKFGHEEDYAYLINYYLQGPTSEECISPFPAGTTLIHLELVKNKVIVTLSSHLALLHGSDLSIACTCLARTLQEMCDMKSVEISAEGDLLDGESSIIIKRNDFVTQDDYFPTESSD